VSRVLKPGSWLVLLLLSAEVSSSRQWSLGITTLLLSRRGPGGPRGPVEAGQRQ